MNTTTRRQIIDQAQEWANDADRVFVILPDAITGKLTRRGIRPATDLMLEDLLASSVVVVAPFRPGTVASAESILRAEFAR